MESPEEEAGRHVRTGLVCPSINQSIKSVSLVPPPWKGHPAEDCSQTADTCSSSGEREREKKMIYFFCNVG